MIRIDHTHGYRAAGTLSNDNAPAAETAGAAGSGTGPDQVAVGTAHLRPLSGSEDCRSRRSLQGRVKRSLVNFWRRIAGRPLHQPEERTYD